MSCLMNLLVAFAALGMSTVVAINFVPDKDEAAAAVYPLVRRESASLSDLHEKVNDAPKDHHQDPMAKSRGQDIWLRTHDIIIENRQFVLMAEGADACTGNGDWYTMTDEICRDASVKLISAVVSHQTAGYWLNNSANATQPHPSACFYEPSTEPKMKFNPLESHGDTITGRKVCMRARFINGTLNADSNGGCTGDSQPILNYNACWAAALAFDGGSPCMTQEMTENQTTVKEDKPRGCYRIAATVPEAELPGCISFNPKTSAPTGTITDSMAICANVVPDAGKITTT